MSTSSALCFIWFELPRDGDVKSLPCVRAELTMHLALAYAIFISPFRFDHSMLGVNVPPTRWWINFTSTPDSEYAKRQKWRACNVSWSVSWLVRAVVWCQRQRKFKPTNQLLEASWRHHFTRGRSALRHWGRRYRLRLLYRRRASSKGPIKPESQPSQWRNLALLKKIVQCIWAVHKTASKLSTIITILVLNGKLLGLRGKDFFLRLFYMYSLWFKVRKTLCPCTWSWLFVCLFEGHIIGASKESTDCSVILSKIMEQD